MTTIKKIRATITFDHEVELEDAIQTLGESVLDDSATLEVADAHGTWRGA